MTAGAVLTIMGGSLQLASLGGDLLCGVVRCDRHASGGSRLTATCASQLLADDAFRALLAEHTG
ncbi:hypothetical protein [Streptomyces griseus]|uniref:hypothetical protein n=1 Tax=Streptomyces griseus TaxID=1911 RepID=UPI000569AB35|nr:hypothetical protein [Streptomyces griseus]